MIRETAEIDQIGADRVRVRINPAQGCAGCVQKSGCGTGLMQAWLNPVQHMWVPVGSGTLSQLAVGDRVELCVQESSFVRSAMLVFMLPIVGMVLGAWAGQGFGQDATAVLFAIIGMLASALLVRLVQKNYAHLLVGTPELQMYNEKKTPEPLVGASVEA